MTLRDGGFAYEDGCPECGAGVREEHDARTDLTRFVCKRDNEECGWTANDTDDTDEDDDT
jgi:predicted RNA-binding Zn-ribbon protein involved in translation (DUF1610 family)